MTNLIRSQGRAARWSMEDPTNVIEGSAIAIVGCASWGFILWAAIMILTH